jgi:hypothetical protein
MALKRCSGQYTLETVVLIKAFLIIIVAALSALYFLYAKQMTLFALHKNNLCMEQYKKTKNQCDRELKAFLKSTIFFKKNIQVSSQNGRFKNTSTADVTFLNFKIKASKTLMVN